MLRSISCTFFVLVAIALKPNNAKDLKEGWALVGNPLLHDRPCDGNDNILLSYEPGRAPGEENRYNVHVTESVPKYSKVFIYFDSETTVKLGEYQRKTARISAFPDNLFIVHFFNSSNSISFAVEGPATGTIPYITSLKVNTVEYCEKPRPGILDKFIQGYQDTAESHQTTPDDSCGRRKVIHTELITNSQPTKAGDWPWHAAIYRLDKSTIKYICGGTVISKFFILTASHCASVRGAPVLPEILSVVLGKYNLIGGDSTTQEKEIHQIILHENFHHRNLSNDIALLKLKTEVQYNDYIQPACLWFTNAYKKLGTQQVFGTVVGWGFDNADNLSQQLSKTTIPKVSETKCLKSNPVFFQTMLTPEKFCAGYANGTSPCNGDSGGSFMVFIPEISGDMSPNATGSWHVRGIVSVAVSLRDRPVCDPHQYVLFTDVAKFRGWISKHIE